MNLPYRTQNVSLNAVWDAKWEQWQEVVALGLTDGRRWLRGSFLECQQTNGYKVLGCESREYMLVTSDVSE